MPIGLFLLFLAEQSLGSGWVVIVLAAMLVAGRVLHPFGLPHSTLCNTSALAPVAWGCRRGSRGFGGGNNPETPTAAAGTLLDRQGSRPTELSVESR